MNQSLIIISALSENHAIGQNNTLPWSLPNDLKRFKALTSGFPIIMGRKTLDSMRGILPGRKHIVLSRSNYPSKPNLVFVKNVKSALEETDGYKKAFVIGGSFIYALFMDKATHMELTHVHHQFENADVFFPSIDYSQWKVINKIDNPIDSKHAYPYTYKTYIRL